MKRDHVFLYVNEDGERKFRGFMIDRATAEKWVKKQSDPSAYEISDEAPGRTEKALTASSTDKGLAKALLAVKEAADD